MKRMDIFGMKGKNPMWKYLFVILAVVFLAFIFRYEIVMSNDHLYKLDRWTGILWEYIRSEALGNRWIPILDNPY
jgi:hypothetical protein